MAISTYDELVAAIPEWTIRDDLAAQTPDFIRLAEANINRVLRVHQMEERATAAVAAEYLALPDAYLDRMSIRLSDGSCVWALDSKPREVFDGFPERTGRPAVFTIVGSELQFYPVPDQPYTARLTYVRSIPPLSPSNQTNWLLTLAPDAYLYGSLLQAAPYLIDSNMAATWGDGFNNAIAGLRAMHRTSGGRLTSEIIGLNDYRGYDIRTDF